MSRFNIEDGDVLRDTRTSTTYVAQGAVFTKRYMDSQDWEMVEHGMGQFAGLYESALCVVNIENGNKSTLRMGHWRLHLENLTAISEDKIKVNTINEMDERRIV